MVIKHLYLHTCFLVSGVCLLVSKALLKLSTLHLRREITDCNHAFITGVLLDDNFSREIKTFFF